VKLFIFDQHSIYRRGLVACVSALEDVSEVTEVGTLPSGSLDHPALAEADVVLLDPDESGSHEFVGRVCQATQGRVLVCSSRCDDTEVLAAIQAGAVGYLCKDTLTPEALGAAIRAAQSGAGVVAPELLGSLLKSMSRVTRELLEPRGLTLSRLTTREQQVLSLVAEGHPTREVAQQLSYSERTVKNVLHDVVTKLNARTRSQAVAQAVREGLI
jgi:DNA-binding NarL/FixJ family response regulator